MADSKPKDGQNSSGMDIPDFAIETLARGLLPMLQAYYESEEGQEALQQWEREHKEI